MSIDPNETNNEAEILVGRFAAQLAAVEDADEAVARMSQPVVPSGGRLEVWVEPQVKRAKKIRAFVRRWTPATVGTVVFLALLFSPAPLTGPLIVYALAMTGFGVWTSFGRPGPRASAALLAHGIAAVWGWLTAAWSKVSGLRHRADTEPDQRPATA